MSAKFRNISVQADLRKQGCDFGSQPPSRTTFFLRRVAQNVSHFFLHATAMPFRAALQP